MFASSELIDKSSLNFNNSSLSPKRSKDLGKDLDFKNQASLKPFRPDAKQYMDKVLNLMNMINEVDDLNNVAELKNKVEKQRLLLLKARYERNELQASFNKQQQIDLELKMQVDTYLSQLKES